MSTLPESTVVDFMVIQQQEENAKQFNEPFTSASCVSQGVSSLKCFEWMNVVKKCLHTSLTQIRLFVQNSRIFL